MVAPLVDQNAPDWMQRFARNLPNVFKTRTPSNPERLARFTYALLPPAADWAGCIVFVSDKNKAAISNGSSWTDPAGGAL